MRLMQGCKRNKRLQFRHDTKINQDGCRKIRPAMHHTMPDGHNRGRQPVFQPGDDDVKRRRMISGRAAIWPKLIGDFQAMGIPGHEMRRRADALNLPGMKLRECSARGFISGEFQGRRPRIQDHDNAVHEVPHACICGVRPARRRQAQPKKSLSPGHLDWPCGSQTLSGTHPMAVEHRQCSRHQPRILIIGAAGQHHRRLGTDNQATRIGI